MELVSLSLGAIVAGLIAKASERAAEDTVEVSEGVLRRVVAAVRERLSRRGDRTVSETLEL